MRTKIRIHHKFVKMTPSRNKICFRSTANAYRPYKNTKLQRFVRKSENKSATNPTVRAQVCRSHSWGCQLQAGYAWSLPCYWRRAEDRTECVWAVLRLSFAHCWCLLPVHTSHCHPNLQRSPKERKRNLLSRRWAHQWPSCYGEPSFGPWKICLLVPCPTSDISLCASNRTYNQAPVCHLLSHCWLCIQCPATIGARLLQRVHGHASHLLLAAVLISHMWAWVNHVMWFDNIQLNIICVQIAYHCGEKTECLLTLYHKLECLMTLCHKLECLMTLYYCWQEWYRGKNAFSHFWYSKNSNKLMPVHADIGEPPSAKVALC